MGKRQEARRNGSLQFPSCAIEKLPRDLAWAIIEYAPNTVFYLRQVSSLIDFFSQKNWKKRVLFPRIRYCSGVFHPQNSCGRDGNAASDNISRRRNTSGRYRLYAIRELGWFPPTSWNQVCFVRQQVVSKLDRSLWEPTIAWLQLVGMNGWTTFRCCGPDLARYNFLFRVATMRCILV